MNALLLTGCAGVYCFRSANGALRLPLLYEFSEPSKGILEAQGCLCYHVHYVCGYHCAVLPEI